MADYISQEAAIALTDQHCFETSYDAVWMEEELRKLPTADMRPVVRGEWLEPDNDYGYLVCSVCEERSPNDERWNFCPNCGADIKKYNK